ncbi:MAG: M1 family aminopeptidase [Candidatus Ventricola sp.]
MNRKRIGALGALLTALLLAALIWAGTAALRGGKSIEAIEPSGERDFVRAVLDYDAGTRTLRGTQTLTLTNRTGGTLEEIVLRAYMNGWDGAQVLVSGASVDGETVSLSEDEDDPTVLRAAYSWASGETVELSFTLRIKHARSDGAALIQLPVLAMWEDGAWREDEYDALADPSYAAPFDYTVQVDGETVAQMRGARDASFALGASAKTAGRQIGGVQVTALAQDTATAKTLLTQAEAALKSLDKIGLPYPYDALTVVQSETGRGDGLALSGLIALQADGDKETLRRRLTRLIARETFGILIENDPWNAPWLSETLASGAELLAYRALKGTAAYEERLYGELELSTRLTRPYGVTVGAGADHFGGDAEMTQVLRDQGAAMLLGIEQAMGGETFMEALQLYIRDNAGSVAVQEDLAAALREASGSSWDGYLADGLSF